MNRNILIILWLVAALLPASAQFAEDAVGIVDNLYGFGARSSAMGTAYTAVADDYSAIYWNPGGLAQIRRMEFYASISNLSYTNESLFNGTTSSADDNFTKFNAIGFVFPVPTFRGSLVFALGYHRVKDFDQTLRFSGFNTSQSGLNFDVDDSTIAFFDEDVRQEEIVNQDGSLNNWSFAGAIDVSPNVSVGLSLNFWTGEQNYSFDFRQDDINDVYNVFPADFDYFSLRQKIISDYSAFQVKAGALIRLKNTLRLGFVVALPTTFNIVENFSSSNEVAYDNLDIIQDDFYYIDDFEFEGGISSEFEYDVSTPFQFSVGAAYQLDNLVVSAALDFIDLSQVKFEIPDDVDLGSEYDELLDENNLIRELYDAESKIKFGAEYTFPDLNVKLRGGYMHVNSPLSGPPSGSDRQIYTAGAGFRIDEQFIIDISYMFGSWEKVSEDIFTPGQVTEKIDYAKLFFGTSFRF